jgi:hypothetical protein
MNDFGEINHVRGASRRDSNEGHEGKKEKKRESAGGAQKRNLL